MDDLFKIGERIRRLRSARGLTQRRLAEPRYTAAYVSSVESGRRRPSTDALQHFASQLAIDYQELVTGRSPGRTAEAGLALAEAALALATGDASGVEPCRTAITDPEPEDATAHAHLALGHWALSRDDGAAVAMAHFASAEKLLSELSLPGRAPAIAGQAKCLLRSGDPSYATYLLETTLAELTRTALPHPEALIPLNAGLAAPYLERGELDHAADAAGEALALSPSYEDPERVARLHLETARGHLAGQHTARANASLAAAYTVIDHLVLRPDIAQCHRARGRRHMRDERLALAADDLRIAHSICAGVRDNRATAAIAAELSAVRRLLGEPDSARDLLDEAMELLGSDGDPGVLAEVRGQAGRLAAYLGDTVTAEPLLREAADLFRRGDRPRGVATTMRLLGDLLARDGRATEAAGAYQAGLDAVGELARRS